MRSTLTLLSVLMVSACQGPPGATGTPGVPGVNGVSGYELQTITLADMNVPRGVLPLPIPPCPGNKRVSGGGLEVSSQNQRVPSEDGRSWRVVLHNDGPAVTQATVTVTKVCVAAT